jgi:hypothetical protein
LDKETNAQASEYRRGVGDGRLGIGTNYVLCGAPKQDGHSGLPPGNIRIKVMEMIKFDSKSPKTVLSKIPTAFIKSTPVCRNKSGKRRSQNKSEGPENL